MENKNSLMNNNWKILKFSDCIIQINTGLNPRNNFSLGNGKIKYITAKNLTKSGIIDFTKCDFIDEKAKSIIHKRSDIEIGDILLSSRAPIGHCHLIREKPCFYDIGESIFSIRVNRKIVLPDYLCLYLTSNYFVKSASLQTTGSIISEIRISDLMNTKIIVPPIYIQNDIAECLYKIDYKIELNKKINDNLQHQLKLIYDYWFTQFDFPDENGKPYRSSGGAMVWNEQLKREIPVGWRVRPLLDIVSWESNSQPPKNEFVYSPKEGYIRFIQNRDYGSNTHITYIPYKESLSIADRLDILMDKYGDAGAVRYGIEGAFNVALGKIKVHEKHYQEYIRSFLESDSIYTFLHNSCMASTRASLNESNLRILNIVLPDNRIITEYQEIAAKIRMSILKNNDEIAMLTKLRDWLLPMLMNGQATISD